MSATNTDVEDLERVKRVKMPDWISPMLATLTDDRFSGENWIYERKLDGERLIAYKRDGNVRLMTRNRKEVGKNYPEVVDALSALDLDGFIVDGEMVAFEGDITSFQKLQGRMHRSGGPGLGRGEVEVFYYLFDIMYLKDHDIRRLPLRKRKALLKHAITFTDPIRYTAHRNEEGMDLYREACEKSWEGIIAKKADSPYVSKRSRSWLKFKCVHQQEMVIGGFTDPEGSRKGFGALLLGYYDSGALVYAGKVGTGFDEKMLEELGEELRSREIDSSPFDRGDPERGAHFVEPDLVGEVGFTEWTSGGKLRHPRFLGLRRDKSPEEVVRESGVIV
jgi:DNA ligase D-like protein (predicted ligase)